jgi:hypothetical protein
VFCFQGVNNQWIPLGILDGMLVAWLSLAALLTGAAGQPQ